MAPGTRRANRSGYAEHDDFEGLPVRQWRQDWVNLAPPAPQEQAQQNDIWAIELIHGMPKDSHLLPPHSQELLRAARSGRLYKRPAPPEDDEVDIDAGQAAEKAEKKEEDHAEQGFSIKLWKQIPRNSEGSGPAYLAKRRKGTVTIASKTVDEKTTPGSTVTRATVRKTDAAGNPYTEEVTLADGQQVVGEIISTRVEAVQIAAADGFAAPAPALRRRPPPPKRKSKAGPGRGKKKVKTELPGQALAARVAQTAGGVGSVSVHGPGAHGIPHEVIGTSNHAENAEVEDDDDDDDEDGDGGEDEEEDDEEGDQQMNDADESKVHDIEMTDAPEEQRPVTPSNNPVVDLDAADGMTTRIGATSSNPFTLAPAIGSLATHSPRNEGSPLKNVRFQSKSQSQSPAPTDSQAAPAVSIEPAKGVPNSAAAAETISVKMPSLDALMGEAPAAETRAESMIAEPPSMPAGDEGITRIDEDVVMTEAVLDEAPMGESQSDVQQYIETRPEGDRFSPDMAPRGDALLPPPPEQVGNITSPRAYEGPERTSDCDEKDEEGRAHESHMRDDRTTALNAYDSILTEDPIQPEDSASIRFPLTESGAPSEVGAASAEETKSLAEAPRQTSPSRPTSPTADTNMDAAAATDPTGDRPMTLDHDEPNVSQESRKDSSGVISVSPEAPPAVQPTQSPAALQHVSNDELREPTPVQAVQSEEQASPLEDAIQDNSLSRVDDPLPPQQSDEVPTQEEPTLDQAVETEPIPETSQIEEKPAASSTDQDAKMDPEDQREEAAESRMDEDPKINPQEQSEEPTTSETNEESKINQDDQKEEPDMSSTSEDAKANQEEQRDELIHEQQQQDPHNERAGSPTEESKSQSQALSLDPEPSPEAVSGPATTEPIDPEASTMNDAAAAVAPSSPPPVLPPTSASPAASTADGAGESHPGAADGPAEATAAAAVDEKTEDAPAGV
ncbi:hypothetical protein E4U13_001605 [Claviceps humidiphila]|uniref:Apopolysialoglycoprotein n=1 Tax=Claviceps humidiphila TaxID=1294629 RepID=A0A9P7Q2M4_9HYPO|nr:hypothetical protein E4U13_001605 [Claviceps humidiphila]